MCCIAGETAAVGLFLKGYALEGMLLHAASAFLLSTVCSGMFVFCLSLSFFVPVLGMIGLLLLSFYSRGKRARISPLHLEMEADSFRTDAGSGIPDVARYLKHYSNLEPLVDILRSEDARMKRHSIERLAAQRTSQAIALLKEATHDRDGSIRLFASTALLHIEQELNDQVQALRDESERLPGNADVLAALASAYYQFCYLDVLDEVSNRYYAELASDTCQRSLELDDNQYHVWVLLGKVRLEHADYVGAELCFRKAVGIEPDRAEAYGWWAESLYVLGWQPELVRCCRRLIELGVDEGRLREAANWWTTEEVSVA